MIRDRFRSSRPRSAAVSLPQSPSRARCAAATAASTSAACDRAMVQRRLPSEGLRRSSRPAASGARQPPPIRTSPLGNQIASCAIPPLLPADCTGTAGFLPRPVAHKRPRASIGARSGGDSADLRAAARLSTKYCFTGGCHRATISGNDGADERRSLRVLPAGCGLPLTKAGRMTEAGQCQLQRAISTPTTSIPSTSSKRLPRTMTGISTGSPTTRSRWRSKASGGPIRSPSPGRAMTRRCA